MAQRKELVAQKRELVAWKREMVALKKELVAPKIVTNSGGRWADVSFEIHDKDY